MLTKGKFRIVTMLLVVAIMATMFMGFACATDDARTASRWSFWISCPGAGGTDTATLRAKELDVNYAYYNLTTVTNNTGYNAYINVRASDKATKAGTADVVYGTGSYYVYYLSGYGNVGSYYCPSGQSSSSSSSAYAVYIEGTWRP